MRWKFKDLFYKKNHTATLMQKNRQRFDSIICSERYNHLQCVYEQLFDWNATVTDTEILKGYFKFSDNIQTNTFAAAELEWVAISVICYFRPHLTEVLIKRGLLAVVYSLGEDIDWFTVLQFIDVRILANGVEPYGGLPPTEGIQWLKDILPQQKQLIQKVLQEVIEENRF